jgi:hypothetical protein
MKTNFAQSANRQLGRASEISSRDARRLSKSIQRAQRALQPAELRRLVTFFSARLSRSIAAQESMVAALVRAGKSPSAAREIVAARNRKSLHLQASKLFLVRETGTATFSPAQLKRRQGSRSIHRVSSADSKTVSANHNSKPEAA